MKILLLFFFTLNFTCFSQKVWIKVNLTNDVSFSFNDYGKDFTSSFKKNEWKQVSITDTFTLSLNKEKGFISIEINGLSINENDSLQFIFLEYQRIDSSYKVSGCKDGSNNENEVEIKKLNRFKKKIKNLPQTISFKLNDNYLTLKKDVVILETTVLSGNGIKYGKEWGFYKYSFIKLVNYVYNE